MNVRLRFLGGRVPCRSTVALFLALCVCCLGGNDAAADVIAMAAELSGPAEVPPNASTARGAAAITVDTASRILTWRVEYSGLSGPVSAAHFHGPASQTANAGILVNIVVPVPPGPLADRKSTRLNSSHT